MLGGESGRPVRIAAGDVLILPAGTGHCRLSASADFALTAAYPADQAKWDLCRPEASGIEWARDRIASVPIPSADPVTGMDGAQTKHWAA